MLQLVENAVKGIDLVVDFRVVGDGVGDEFFEDAAVSFAKAVEGDAGVAFGDAQVGRGLGVGGAGVVTSDG